MVKNVNFFFSPFFLGVVGVQTSRYELFSCYKWVFNDYNRILIGLYYGFCIILTLTLWRLHLPRILEELVKIKSLLQNPLRPIILIAQCLMTTQADIIRLIICQVASIPKIVSLMQLQRRIWWESFLWMLSWICFIQLLPITDDKVCFWCFGLQGNEYFKQKKFKEAIDCYSRSIALLPTAVAYANRAMAYLKLRRLVLSLTIWSAENLNMGFCIEFKV